MSGVGLTGKIVPLNGGAFTVFDGGPVANLAALSALAGCVTGTRVYVADQDEFYQLDSDNSFAVSSPLIITAFGTGRWFRRNKSYVVGNFTTWIATSNFAGKNLIIGYTPGQLIATATVTPDIILTGPASNTSWSAVPDLLGNLWWNIEGLAAGVQVVRKLALKDCLSSGTPTPSVILNITSTGTTSGTIAFDKSNQLWIDINDSSMKKISQSQYAVSGTITPVMNFTVTGVPGSVQYSMFDDVGNLWMGGNNIAMITAAQLAAAQVANSAAIVPTVIWSGANVSTPSGMAFGPTGLLWSANYAAGAGHVRAYNPIGAVTGNPAIVIDITCASFVGVTDIFFDSSGNLWFLNFDNGKLGRIAAANLTVSGAVVADFVVTFGGTAAGTFPPSFNYPNNPTRSGLVPSGAPITP